MPKDEKLPAPKPTSSPDSLVTTENTRIELDESELDKATGGYSNLSIMKVIDKSSP